jgi:hypothetical protein
VVREEKDDAEVVELVHWEEEDAEAVVQDFCTLQKPDSPAHQSRCRRWASVLEACCPIYYAHRRMDQGSSEYLDRKKKDRV